MVQQTGGVLRDTHGRASDGSLGIIRCQFPFEHLLMCETTALRRYKNGSLAFRNGQEPNQGESVLVSSSDVVTDVPNRKVDGMIFVLAGRHGNSGLVTPEYDRDKNCPMRVSVKGNDVLFQRVNLCFRIGGKVYVRIDSKPSPQT